MVRVQIDRASDGSIAGFAIEGHAGAAARGRDIVCAGVSAVAQTAVLGLERRLGLDMGVSAGRGRLACRLPAELTPEGARRAQDVLETMCLGLKSIARAHPARVRVADTRRAAVAAGGAGGRWAGAEGFGASGGAAGPW